MIRWFRVAPPRSYRPLAERVEVVRLRQRIAFLETENTALRAELDVERRKRRWVTPYAWNHRHAPSVLPVGRHAADAPTDVLGRHR